MSGDSDPCYAPTPPRHANIRAEEAFKTMLNGRGVASIDNGGTKIIYVSGSIRECCRRSCVAGDAPHLVRQCIGPAICVRSLQIFGYDWGDQQISRGDGVHYACQPAQSFCSRRATSTVRLSHFLHDFTDLRNRRLDQIVSVQSHLAAPAYSRRNLRSGVPVAIRLP